MVCVALLVGGCGEKETRSQLYSNGAKKSEITYKIENFLLESYSYPWSAKVWKINGEPCAESTLKDGNGVMIWHRDDGSKLQETVYVNGKDHGTEIDNNSDV